MNELFIGTIKDGKWYFNDRRRWALWVQSKGPGQYVLREPTSINDDRSINQNALYWKRNQEIADKTGYTKDEIHEYIMSETGNIYETDVFNKVVTVRTSSTKLNKQEFSRLFDKQREIVDSYNDGMPEKARIELTKTGD